MIANYVNGTPSGPTGDDDVYTRFAYTDGLRTKLWVDFDGDGTEDAGDQVTTYTYGTAGGGATGDSEIATGHLSLCKNSENAFARRLQGFHIASR